MISKGKNTKPAEPKEKKGGFLRRLAALAAIVCLVLGLVILTTMEDGRHLAALRRWLMYGESSSTHDAYVYAADPANRYGRLGDSLLVVSPNTLQMVADDGSIRYNMALNMKSPQISVGSRQAVVCDVEGNTLHVLNQNGVRRTMTAGRDLYYYSARLNRSDYLAVTAQKGGYKAAVSVYNSAGDLIFHFDSYDNYISDAVVTEDCRSVVMVSLESSGGAFASRLLVYNLETTEQTGSCLIRDGLVLDYVCNGDRVLTLCDKRFTLTTLAGEVLLDRPYDNLYLHEYALNGKDFCALLLGRYQAGNICTLITYDLDGQRIASLELTEEVLDIAAAGDYLAVLYGERLVIYDRNLVEYTSLEGTDYAAQIQMESGGPVLLIAGSSAWRFLP